MEFISLLVLLVVSFLSWFASPTVIIWIIRILTTITILYFIAIVLIIARAYGFI
jgi:hypothetical protein